MLVAGPVRPAHEQDVVGGVRAGDPRLLPVDDVAAVLALGPAAEVADVGAGLGLGHRDRLDPAARDAAEDLLLELLGAEPADGARRDHADAEEPHRDQPEGELLAEQAQVDRAAAGAAVLLGDRDPEPPELGDPRVQLRVVRLLSVVGERVTLLTGAALAAGEVADRLDKRALLVGQGLDGHALSWARGIAAGHGSTPSLAVCQQQPVVRMVRI